MHANTAADVPARLEALGSQAGLDRLSLHSQLRAALDVVIHLVRDQRTGRRRVAELHMLVGDERGLAVTVPAVTFTARGDTLPGPGWERLRRRCAERGVELPDLAVAPAPVPAEAGGMAGAMASGPGPGPGPTSAEVAR